MKTPKKQRKPFENQKMKKNFSRPTAAKPRFALAILAPFCVIKHKTSCVIDTPPVDYWILNLKDEFNTW